MTKFKEWEIGAIDLLVGGTPCQSFSVAGLRKGLEDPRGNLALVYCGILDRFKPKWFVWENVPGVLSSSGGRDFGSFLGAVAELGYGFAYRVLDAQFFGVAQRRRRVFVVGCLGDWRSAAEVLFEPESLCGDSPPSREKGQAAPTSPSSGVDANGLQHTVGTLCADTHPGAYSGQDAYTGRLVPQAIALAENTIGRQPQNGGNGDGFTVGGPMYTLNATGVHGVAQTIAFQLNGDRNNPGVSVSEDRAFCLPANPMSDRGQAVAQHMAVRRLTPTECERLQGFPDNYTNITWRKQPESPDGPRYKALGNSMAVPVMAWIGKRIQQMENV
jgi:DNA (cytosine-5)-methyltransferase 1